MPRHGVDEWFWSIQDLQRLDEEMAPSRPAVASDRSWRPRVDIVEDDRRVLVKAEIAGVRGEDIQILYIPERRSLVIRGYRHDHGPTGAGNGIVTEYGLVGVANFQTDRIRQMPDGQIFYTIAHGKGLMNGYPHIAPEDRWAIVAYLRALQRAQNAKLEDVPEDKKGSLNPYE